MIDDAADPLAMHDVRPEHGEMLSLLREILDEVRALRFDRAMPVAAISRFDRERGVVLLPAVSEAIGDEPFTARALIARAVEADALLRVSLETVLGRLDDRACRRLGKLLSRVEGFDLDGYRVERGEDHPRDGATWRVVRL